MAPVLQALADSGKDWVRPLLHLAEHPRGSPAISPVLGLVFQRGHSGDRELALRPPVRLLSWPVRHPEALARRTDLDDSRSALLQGQADVVGRALDLLRSAGEDRAWYIFEGPTYPDAVIETQDALVVIDGKRTEPGPTTSTTWLRGRHQIWRHIDAAWERKSMEQVTSADNLRTNCAGCHHDRFPKTALGLSGSSLPTSLTPGLVKAYATPARTQRGRATVCA